MPFLTSASSAVKLYVSIGATKLAFTLPFRSESVNPRANQITSEAILGSRAVSGATITSRTFQGSVDIELFDNTTSGTGAVKHRLLGVLLWLILGNYNGTNEQVTLGSSAPKIDFLEIEHGASANLLRLSDAYVSGLTLRFPADGIPTATLDVLGATTSGTTPSGYTSVSSWSNYYTAQNLSLSLGGTAHTTRIRNFEISFNQNLLQAFAWGSLNVAEITPAMLDMAQVTLEFYDEAWSSGLYNALQTIYNSAAASTQNLIVTVASPSVSGTNATITMTNFYVTELSHDISTNDYIVHRATILVPAGNITVGGIKFA